MTRGSATVHIRPVIDRDDVDHLVDVQELLLELTDDDGAVRLVEIGRKRLPDDDADSPNWGYVRAAGTDPDEVRSLLDGWTYRTATQGVREQSPTTVAARGDWELQRSGASTLLRLRLDHEVGDELAAELQLRPEAVYGLSVKNPRAGGDAGLDEEERASLPDELQEVFDGNRWAPADPVDLLDHEGVEFVLTPAEVD